MTNKKYHNIVNNVAKHLYRLHGGQDQEVIYRCDPRKDKKRRIMKSRFCNEDPVWESVVKDLETMGFKGYEVYRSESRSNKYQSGIVRVEA